jgi:hypothetical protein
MVAVDGLDQCHPESRLLIRRTSGEHHNFQQPKLPFAREVLPRDPQHTVSGKPYASHPPNGSTRQTPRTPVQPALSTRCFRWLSIIDHRRRPDLRQQRHIPLFKVVRARACHYWRCCMSAFPRKVPLCFRMHCHLTDGSGECKVSLHGCTSTMCSQGSSILSTTNHVSVSSPESRMSNDCPYHRKWCTPSVACPPNT